WGAVRPVEQADARHAELLGDRTGDHLRLVVPAPAHPSVAGPRPRDDVDTWEVKATDHLLGEHVGRGAAVAELQRDDELTGDTVERKCGDDAVGRAQLIDRR